MVNLLDVVHCRQQEHCQEQVAISFSSVGHLFVAVFLLAAWTTDGHVALAAGKRQHDSYTVTTSLDAAIRHVAHP